MASRRSSSSATSRSTRTAPTRCPGLLRGRRGTDVFVDGHAAGELFVLLDPDDVETLVTALGDLDLPRSWRAVGFGTLFEDAETLTQSHTGRDLKPYAPWNVQAALTGSPADISLSWVRRTRIGGELKDGTGTVPLGEASEAYEVDILDGPGGAVLRTLAVYDARASSTPTPTSSPTSAPCRPSSSIAVYQLSATVGRGFARTVTLEISDAQPQSRRHPCRGRAEPERGDDQRRHRCARQCDEPGACRWPWPMPT